ncbi:MAG: hypothetical protein V3T54_01680 [Acidobacteriota bacterium]
MARALGTLILTAILFQVLTFISGWTTHMGWFRLPQHVMWGLLTAILILFAHTAAMFYLIGRGRYVRDVTRELSLRVDFCQKSKLFKWLFFSRATYSILMTIGVTTAGGAATLRGFGHSVHGALAIGALFLNLLALWRGLMVIGQDLQLGNEMEEAAAAASRGSSGD